MTAVREYRETIRYLSRREIAQERTELFQVINVDAFFPIKTWPEDMRMTFLAKAYRRCWNIQTHAFCAWERLFT